MSSHQSYTIIYAPITREHLRTIDRKYYSLIRSTIEQRLGHEPDTENRNRKPLRRTAFDEASWELRFGPENMFRVFYDIHLTEREVHILVIGMKVREKLYIAGKEINP